MVIFNYGSNEETEIGEPHVDIGNINAIGPVEDVTGMCPVGAFRQ